MHPVSLRSRLFAPLAGLAAVCSFVTAVQAATITWGSATNISGDTDVSNLGTTYYAANLGFSGGSAAPNGTWGPSTQTTINGVTFAGIYLNTMSTSSSVVSTVVTFTPSSAIDTNAGISVKGTTSTTFGSTINGGTTLATAFSSLTTNYQSLLGQAVYGATTLSPTLTFSGLTQGKTYQFQWWASDTRSNQANGFSVTATAGNSVTLDVNTSSSGNALGQYALGTFTADASTQSIVFSQAGAMQINGFQLRDISSIPEPSTYAALAGAGVLGLAVLRRRQRKA